MDAAHVVYAAMRHEVQDLLAKPPMDSGFFLNPDERALHPDPKSAGCIRADSLANLAEQRGLQVLAAKERVRAYAALHLGELLA